MRLLLIRHGQSHNNRLEHGPAYGQERLPDPPLTDVGRQQAERLAHWAIHDPVFGQVTRLFTSLTTRAVQTAAPLARTLRLDVHGLARAYECGGLSSGPAGGFAPVPGRDHASLQGDCPVLHWPEELEGRAWDGGCEAWEDVRFAARAAQVLSHLQAAADEGDVVALITHQDFAQYLLAAALGLPRPTGGALTFILNNTATVFLECPAHAGECGGRTVHWVNRTAHLSADLLTH